MASNINDWLNKILTARYGEEVRGSIYNSIKLFNDILNETSSQFNKDAAAVAAGISAAQQAAAAANTAKTGAEAAKTAAESAKTGAEKAKSDTIQYANIAGGYATTAQNAKTAAEKARDDTIAAKDTSVQAIMDQQAASAQAVINTGNEVKASITAQQNASVQAVKDQETASKAAVQTQQNTSTAAVESAKSEALTEVGTAKEEALQAIGDAADDIISGGDSLYVKKTGDAISGVVTAPEPLPNAVDGQLATVGFVKNNTPKDAVTKEGTSVVIGDIQVPDPETESSVVPRSYADGNGYTQAVNDGIPSAFSKNTYKNAMIYSEYVARAYSDKIDDNNKYFPLFTTRKSNNAIRIVGAMGNQSQERGVDLFVQLDTSGITLVKNMSIVTDSSACDLVFYSTDNSTVTCYLHKHTNQWAGCLLRVQTLHNTTVLASIPDEEQKWIEAPVGELIYSWSEDTGRVWATSSYADAVPYQYAEAAGYKYGETALKKAISEEGSWFLTYNSNSITPGYKRLARSRDTIGSNSGLDTLFIEGYLRGFANNNFFKISISNRVTPPSVTLCGYGTKISGIGNIVLVKSEDNYYEVYYEKISTDYKWMICGLKLSSSYRTQWNLDDFSKTSLTSGDIPGTRVWDLKTAWGDTSRTQITKEEVVSKYFPISGGTVNGDVSLGRFNSTTDQSRRFNLMFNDVGGVVQQFSGISDTTPYITHLSRAKSGDNWGSVILRNVHAPVGDLDAVNYATLKSYVAANAGGFTPANNAGAHNSIFRGKSLGTTITAAQFTAISNGTFTDMYIGDYWSSSTGTRFIIAAFNSTEYSGNHIIIIQDTTLQTGCFFPSGQTSTSLSASDTNQCSTWMALGPLNSATRIINDADKSHVFTMSRSRGQGWKPITGLWSKYELANAQAWYLSEMQVFGNETLSKFDGVEESIFTFSDRSLAYNYAVPPDVQFPLFKLNPRAIKCSDGDYWLRDIYPRSNGSICDTFGVCVIGFQRKGELVYDATNNVTSNTTHKYRPYYIIV